MRVLAIVLSLVALHGAAAARVCKDPCVEAARQSYRECRRDVAETLRVSRALCRGRDVGCVQACVVNEASCIQATGLVAALETCLGDGAAAVQSCLTRFTTQPKKRKQCVDQAQLTTFQCRNEARTSRRRDVARCAVEYRRCARPCGPKLPPRGSRACLAEATDTRDQAVATCNQVADADKNACTTKDPACVQTCRDDRTACTSPFDDAIDTAVDACNATRRSAVAACTADNPPGTARDACIQTANSDAFVCRDDARQAQASALAQCTATYVACVRSCPGA